MDDLIKELSEFSVPELCDGQGLYNTMDYEIKPFVTKEKIIGKALTVKIPIGEGSIVTNAIEAVNPGDVIVIAGHGNCKSSYWGDHRSYCAKLKKAAGVVIDGAFRDIDGCEEVGFPVYAKAITPGTAGKSGDGEINVPISCGGVIVNPGDIIVGDRNGVCVIPKKDAPKIIEKARHKRERQRWTVEEMNRTGIVMPRIILK